MIFENPPRNASKTNIWKYVQVDLYTWMRNITAGFNGRLNFKDNFNSFLAENITIAAGATAIIENKMNVIPTERYIVRQTGNGVITDGVWDLNQLRLVNQGATSVTINVRFFYIP